MTLPNPWMILPFALLLMAMALASTLAPGWWHRHYPKVALGLGAVTLFYYFFVLRDLPRVLETAHDYLGFIALAGSLYVVAGAIHIQVKGTATPFGNVLFLLAGAVIANILGTTGAAMLLIRPWIRLNRSRIAARHIVFFIFLVANVGGCLTPVGDPPLFLGYLQGVPFWWITRNAWPMWTVAVGFLLALFFVLEKIHLHKYSRSPGSRAGEMAPEQLPVAESWKFQGLTNLFWLAAILGAVFVSRPMFLREVIMVAAALGSWFTTPKAIHAANNFNFHPVREVIILFAGVFATMMPALDWLNFRATDLLGSHPAPGIFFWGTGGLSAVLDNAPTYLGFVSALSGVTGAPAVSALAGQSPAALVAVSVGAVFFGAATYIGNAPNFMIKAIAGEERVPAPGFLQFIGQYALPFLLPALLIVWLAFFRS